MILEVAGLQGLGLLFAGIGAIILGALINLGILTVATATSAIAYFFLFTIISALVLWKPLKRLTSKSSDNFSDVIGTQATVDDIEGLVKNKPGTVKWSGVRMRAEIHPDSQVNIIENNTIVWVIAKNNGVLLVDINKP